MADTGIEWADKVWNPCTGCNKISPGCKFCYAEVMHRRQQGITPGKYAHDFLEGAFEYEPALPIPFGWKKPAMVFPTSMSDLFHKNISVEFIAKVYAVMFLTERHTYQMLTKRADRRLQVLQSDEFFEYLHKYCNQFHHKYISPLEQELYFYDEIKSLFPFKNVWEGTSTEDQLRAELRIPMLLKTPAAVRWISAEPLIGQVDLSKIPGAEKLDWVVAGGESGNKEGVRPMHINWLRSLRDQSKAAGTAFFFKQWGEYFPYAYWLKNHIKEPEPSPKLIWVDDDGKTMAEPDLDTVIGRNMILVAKVGKKESGRLLDGREWNEYPNVQSEKQIAV